MLRQYVCDNCDTIFQEGDASIEPLGIGQWGACEPGCEVPAGVCPCGAMVYLDDELSEMGKLRNAARALVDLVNVTGGVRRLESGLHAPVCDEDWIDLGELYVSVCDLLGEEPKIDDEEV